MKQWFYRRESVETGPLTLEELRTAVSGDRISVADFVRRGDENWLPAGACPELTGMFGKLPPPLTPTYAVMTANAVPKPIWPWLVGAGSVALVVLVIIVTIAGFAGSPPSETAPKTAAASPTLPEAAVGAPSGPVIDISGVDATPELGRIIANMNDEQKLAIGFYNATTGLDFYAAQVRISNSGDQSYFINPKNIRLHLYGESVGILPMKDSRFLQPTKLLPDHYIEGMVVYLAAPHAGAAMRLGEGSISYEFAD